MRKQRTYEENSVQNLQIQEQFDKLMQIQGLSLSRQAPKDPFPSVKSLFHPNTSVNIIGQGPNTNIRAFYYLLLCHIRKQHLSKLVHEKKLKQASQIELQESGRRDRRVSFNNKATIFLNGPHQQNYALHKLKIYAFSSTTDLMVINNSPFEKQSVFTFKGNKMTSNQLKKLLSQFLKQLLPTQLPQNHRQTLKSVRYYLNQHKVSGIILTLVIRFVLFSNYDIESAQNYEQQLNDHTVYTTLCDAFAINGLMCKQNLFQINTCCKVYSVNPDKGKEIFVQMYNDEFEQLGFVNDNKNALKCRQVASQMSISSGLKQSKGIFNSEELFASGQYLPSFKISPKLQTDNMSSSQHNQKDESNSMMPQDEDSEISYEGDEWKKAKNQLISALSDELRSNDEHSNSINDGFRQTFNSNSRKLQAYILKQIQIQQSQLKQDSSYKKKEEVKTQPLLEESKEDETNSQYKRLPLDNQEGCTSPKLLQKLNALRNRVTKIPKVISSSQEKHTSLLNNSISNNIYVTLGGHNKPYVPAITITSTNKDPNCINIKLS